MSPSSNRGRLTLFPLGTDRLIQLTRPKSWQLPKNAILVAELSRDGERGWLIQLPGGRFAHFTRAHAIRAIDQRKTEAALAQISK